MPPSKITNGNRALGFEAPLWATGENRDFSLSASNGEKVGVRCRIPRVPPEARWYTIKAKDVRWEFGMLPVNNANYAWIQHFIHHLSSVGVAGFVMTNGSMSTQTSNEGAK